MENHTLYPSLSLHVYCFVEAEYPVALHISINTLRSRLSAWVCDLEASRLCNVFGRRIRNVCDENEAGRLDRFDKRRGE